MTSSRPRNRNQLLPGLTWRSLVFGIVFMVLNIYWMIQVSALGTISQFRPGAVSPFVNAIFSLFVLALVNLALKNFWPRWAMSVPELIVVYVMTNIGTAIVSTDMVQVILTLMHYPFWFATPENGWASLFHQYIPTWLSVRDLTVLKPFYEGHSTLYTAHHIKAWLGPVLAWCGLIFVLLFIMLCINIIVRSQWTDRERLTYPIVELPLAMTEGEVWFFRSRAMWVGLGIAAVIGIINGLSFLYPLVPITPFRRFELTHFFPRTHPWNGLWHIDYCLFPCIIGLGFLIPLDLLFSSWFFFLFGQVEGVVSEMMGWGLGDPHARYYIFARSYGAYLGLAISLLWLSKGYLKQVWRRAWGLPSEVDDSGEPLSYRWAILGLLGGGIFLLVFCLLAGMSVPMIIIFFLIYFTMSLVTTRIRAEVGLIGTGLSTPRPDYLIISALGSRPISPNNLAMFTMFYGFNRFYRAHPMPHQLEGFKMASSAKMEGRRMSAALIIAAGVGALASFWLLLHCYYQVGAGMATTYGYARMFGGTPIPRLSVWLESPVKPDYAQVGNIGGGIVVTMFLSFMRTRFLGWPFHPVGYALGPSLNQVWMAVFVAWLIKLIILRYWGLKGYRAALPFFLGLMLGDYLIGTSWTLIGLAFGIKTYNFINL